MKEVIDMMEHIRREQSILELAAKDQIKQAQIANKARMELSRQMEIVIRNMERIRLAAV